MSGYLDSVRNSFEMNGSFLKSLFLASNFISVQPNLTAQNDDHDSKENHDQDDNQKNRTNKEETRRAKTAPISSRRKHSERLCNSDIYPVRSVIHPEDQRSSSSIGPSFMKTVGCSDDASILGRKDRYLNASANVSAQVDEYDLDEFVRTSMPGAEQLNLALDLAEMLANAALLAGSVQNITVNCVLLPGSILK